MEPPNKILMKDGRLYRDHLKEKESLNEKAHFELDAVFGRTLKSMLAWDYTDPRFVDIPLEALADPSLGEFTLEKLSETFDVFRNRKQHVRQAYRHIMKISAVRERHGTQQPGEIAKELFSQDVLERLEREYPGVARLEERVKSEVHRLKGVMASSDTR